MNMLKTIRKTQENDLTSIKERKSEVKEKIAQGKPHINHPFTHIHTLVHTPTQGHIHTHSHFTKGDK